MSTSEMNSPPAQSTLASSASSQMSFALVVVVVGPDMRDVILKCSNISCIWFFCWQIYYSADESTLFVGHDSTSC